MFTSSAEQDISTGERERDGSRRVSGWHDGSLSEPSARMFQLYYTYNYLYIYIYREREIYIYIYIHTHVYVCICIYTYMPQRSRLGLQVALMCIEMPTTTIGRDRRDFRQRDCTENRGAIRLVMLETTLFSALCQTALCQTALWSPPTQVADCVSRPVSEPLRQLL